MVAEFKASSGIALQKALYGSVNMQNRHMARLRVVLQGMRPNGREGTQV